MNFLCSADWHFNHGPDDNTVGILEFERGNKFTTIQEHDEYITQRIRHWFSQYTEDYTFYFLGDFGRPTDETLVELREIFSQARCKTVAIRGNHDGEAETAQMKELFDEVYDYPIWISHRVVLSHFPCNVWPDQINIHGHLHGSVLNSLNHVCANIHLSNYQSISNRYVDGCLKHVLRYNRRFLWEPWAAQYRITQKKEDCICDKDGNIDLAASRVMQYLNQESRNKHGESE